MPLTFLLSPCSSPVFISASGFVISWKQFSSFLVTLKSCVSWKACTSTLHMVLIVLLCHWNTCHHWETDRWSELTEGTVSLGGMFDRVEFYKWLVHSFFWCVCIRMILLSWATWQVMGVQQWIILRPQAYFVLYYIFTYVLLDILIYCIGVLPHPICDLCNSQIFLKFRFISSMSRLKHFSGFMLLLELRPNSSFSLPTSCVNLLALIPKLVKWHSKMNPQKSVIKK